jgi:hypothetical protein
MSTPGRNDLCPCGSGKKYKRCHGAALPSTDESVYERLRRLEGEASDLLLRHARRRYGESCLEVAREQFCEPEDTAYSRDDRDQSYFLRWFEYDWRPEDEETLAEEFLSDLRAKNIHSDIRRVIEATLSHPYSFFQIIDIEPGAAITARDVLRHHDVRITERTASLQLEKGNILFARVVEMDGVSFMMGNGTQPLRAVYLRELQEVRQDLAEIGTLDAEPEGSEILCDSEEFLRDVYFTLAKAQTKSITDIRNADGDPLVLHTLQYAIPSFDIAFDALKELEQRETGASDADLLAKDEVGEDGIPLRARIHWLKRRRKGDQTLSAVATFTLMDTTMTVDVNSDKRSRLIRKEISKRLGEQATLVHIDVTPAEGMMKETLKKPVSRESKGESESARLIRESPEVRELLRDTMKKHWESWPDTPIPALRGMTPRQAVKDKLGRELLESLLLEFEVRSARTEEEFNKIDVDELRRKLGLRK